MTAWVRRWKDPIFVAVMIPTATVAFWAAVKVKAYNEQQAEDQKTVLVLARQQAKIAAAQTARDAETAQLTRDQCIRSKALGPSLAQDYEIRQVLTGEKLRLYRSLIPKTCPKAP